MPEAVAQWKDLETKEKENWNLKAKEDVSENKEEDDKKTRKTPKKSGI